MITPLEDSVQFRNARKTAWLNNAAFWLQFRTEDLVLVRKVRSAVLSLMSSRAATGLATVADIGFGSAWLLSELRLAGVMYKYLGLDASETFVARARDTYARDTNASFECVDFENELPNTLVHSCDIAVACLSLCEMAELDRAMENLSLLLKDRGHALIVLLDPVQQIVRSEQTHLGQRRALSMFRALSGKCILSKRIKIGRRRSQQDYYTILYPMDAVADVGRLNGLYVKDLDAVGYEGYRAWDDPIFEILLLEKHAANESV